MIARLPNLHAPLDIQIWIRSHGAKGHARMFRTIIVCPARAIKMPRGRKYNMGEGIARFSHHSVCSLLRLSLGRVKEEVGSGECNPENGGIWCILSALN